MRDMRNSYTVLVRKFERYRAFGEGNNIWDVIMDK
jgi:hypothetical protein